MRLCVPVLLLLSSCVDSSEQLGEGTQGVVVDNRISLNRISLNRISLNRISLNRISLNRISLNRLRANFESIGDLVNTPEGRELFSFTVSCALPAGQTLVVPQSGGRPDLLFSGEIGLAPTWETKPLNDTDQGWISACLLSRVNNNNVTVQVSLRGPSNALATTSAERAAYTVEEGAFYGDIFQPAGEPLQMFACRGRGQALLPETGDLDARDCAEPDPAHPGFTKCGDDSGRIVFAGDCADFVAPANPYACRERSSQGFYEKCATGDDDDGHGNGHSSHGNGNGNGHDKHDDAYKQVITAYLQPS